MHVCMGGRLLAWIHMCVCIYTYACTCTNIHTYTYNIYKIIYAYMGVCMHVCR